MRCQSLLTRLSAVTGSCVGPAPNAGNRSEAWRRQGRRPACSWGLRGLDRHSRRSRAAELSYRRTDGRTDGQTDARTGADSKPPPSVGAVPTPTHERVCRSVPLHEHPLSPLGIFSCRNASCLSRLLPEASSSKQNSNIRNPLNRQACIAYTQGKRLMPPHKFYFQQCQDAGAAT